MARSDDAEIKLIEKVRAGEHEAFRQLVEVHQDRVFRVCVLVLRDAARAEELAQDTFVTAFRKLDQFDAAKGAFATWLLTIAKRLSINATKKATPILMADPPEQAIRTSELPDCRASRAETFRSLDRALAELSEEHRRAFVLAEVEEVSHGDIAAIEGVAVGTVKSRVSRAKEMLRGLLRPIYEELKNETQ